MGNCSLKAVSDGGQEHNSEQSKGQRVRVTSISPKTSIVGVMPVSGNGVWKVKLAIDPRDLEQILSEDGNTEALIEQVRIAANSTPKRRKSHWSGLNGAHLSHMCVT